MTPEDIPRLEALIERTSDPEIKTAAHEAILAILKAPVRHEKRLEAAETRTQRADDREETRFGVSIALSIIAALLLIVLWAVGVISPGKATAGAFTVLAGNFISKVLGVRLPKVKSED